LFLLLVLTALVYYFQNRASQGHVEVVRKLPPLEAIDTAIGRAIELGKPVMVTYSFRDRFDAPTMVGLESVRYISKMTAEKGGTVLTGAGAARTLPVAIENYRQGTIEGGHPELFNDSNVHFFTRQQWAYASGVMGLMQREQPGACFFLGPFLVEGIHLGINSRRINTMAIGGNTSYSMAAFMFVTMDYVLLGEELLAAGAYMTENPVTISGIAAEDVAKWIIAIILVTGSAMKLVGSDLIIQILGM